MASSYDTFRDVNFTRDEVEKITEALKNKEFRKLLVDYVEEVKNPETQKLYQKEITELEKERGVDVTFINPVAGYVIKTSVNGNKKCFINICANENIQKPAATPGVQEGSRGLQWSLPHSLAPPREDLDNKGVRCQVFDVVFHPDTLHLASKNKAFRNMINSTACNAVETNYDVTLDKKNLKFPKLQYKGFPQAAVIRKPSTEQPPELSPEEKEIMDKLYAQIDASKPEPKSPKKSRKSPKKSQNVDEDSSAYTIPQYTVKHRRHLELEEFTEHKTAKMSTATPKELVIEVNLPLLRSSADIVLDVAEKTLQLTSEKPAKYKLALTLPYRVSQDSGNAKFDKDQKKLVVTLPVKPIKEFYLSDIANRDDSGVESDHGSLISTSPTEEVAERDSSLITEIHSENAEHKKAEAEPADTEPRPFLDPNLQYSLPEFTSHVFENTIAFTLNVKNVDESSMDHQITEDDLHLKFSSISAGFYPVHYAFYVKLPDRKIDTETASIEAWDNNVIVQISCAPCDNSISAYLVGSDEADLSEKHFEEPSIINGLLESAAAAAKKTKTQPGEGPTVGNPAEESRDEAFAKPKPKKEKKKGKGVNKKKGAGLQETNNHETATETEEDEDQNEETTKNTNAINILRNYSESSSDEISQSFSPTKGRGILKGLPGTRRFGRSISESGLDEVSWASSVENCYTSVDSVIPEEGEVSTSYKKTVRFNTVVSRQLFRSNSSILGQRKKNQRKAKAKKRAQERRHSEGEITSETEEKKERDTETGDECENSEGNEEGNKGKGSKEDDKGYFASDIFQLDMNF